MLGLRVVVFRAGGTPGLRIPFCAFYCWYPDGARWIFVDLGWSLALNGAMRALIILLIAVTGFAAEVELRISTGDGRSRYYIGEEIPIVLRFEGPAGQALNVIPAQAERLPGVTGWDEFRVTPEEGWRIPVGDCTRGREGWRAHLAGRRSAIRGWWR